MPATVSTISKDFLGTAPKRELVRCVRDLHRLRKTAAPGNSVLMGTRNADLVASIRKLCGRDYELDAAGRVTARGGATDPAAAGSGAQATGKPGRGKRAGAAAGAAEHGPQARSAGAARMDRTAIIRLLATENPKRAGTAAHARFAALRDGMTVADYIAAAGPIASGTLRKAIRRGHVRLEEPAAGAD
jgi:hypothetical protein